MIALVRSSGKRSGTWYLRYFYYSSPVELERLKDYNPSLEVLGERDGGRLQYESLRFSVKSFWIDETGTWLKDEYEIRRLFNKPPRPSKPSRADLTGPLKVFMIAYDNLKRGPARLKYLAEGIENGLIGLDLIQEQVDDSEFYRFLKYIPLERLKELHYYIPSCREELEVVRGKSQEFYDSLKATFKERKRYTLEDIKYELGRIYESFDQKRTPKATNLKDWFDVEEVWMMDGSGKRIKGYRIVSFKKLVQLFS